jgi:hypothetical protein
VLTGIRVADTSTRYVAEENVNLIPLNEMPVEDNLVDRFPIDIGRWFLKFDREKGEFVPSGGVRAEYPHL